MIGHLVCSASCMSTLTGAQSGRPYSGITVVAAWLYTWLRLSSPAIVGYILADR